MTAVAVSFDFDNTLLLSEATKHSTMREVVAKHAGGLEVLATVPSDSRTAPPGVKVTRHTIFAGVAQGLVARGFDVASVGHSDPQSFGVALCDEFSALVEQRLKTAPEVPGATALLKHLAEHGIKCFVNTATPQEPIDQVIDNLGWRPYFCGVYGAPATKVENLRRAARAAAPDESPTVLSAGQMLHVGDGDNDCKAAYEYGCRFVGVALSVANGGSGAPDGGFTRPCHAIVPDMNAAAIVLCDLLGLPPPATATSPTADESRASNGGRASGHATRPAARGCRCVDLGYALSESCVSWPTCDPLSRRKLKSPESSAPPGARSKQSYTLNGGTGTHLDAPSHFIVGGRTIEQLTPLELVHVPLAVIDARPRQKASATTGGKRARDGSASAMAASAMAAACEGDDLLSLEAVTADEAAHGPIPPHALVCVRTGWASARYHERALYFNQTDAADLDQTLGIPRMHFPGISAEAASYLVESRACVGVGIDTLSPDGGSASGRCRFSRM